MTPSDGSPCDLQTSWAFPRPPDGAGDLVALGADLAPGTLLAAYGAGYFPMRVADGSLGWWSPDPRGVLPMEGLHVSRSLRRAIPRFEFRVDTAFETVMRACADRPSDRWIDEDFVQAYCELHRLGWAHSFEAWSGEELTGGMYGVGIGRLFAAESMFHRATDAGKVALARAVAWLHRQGFQLFDVQWQTPHLETLGVVEVSRARYLQLLAGATDPTP